VAPNIGTDIRYMIYFRINARADYQHHELPMLQIWTDFHPLFSQWRSETAPSTPLPLSPAGAGANFTSIRQQLDWLLQQDLQNFEERVRAEQLFEAQQWDDCAIALPKLAEANPDDGVLALYAGLCLSRTAPVHLPAGERHLRMVTQHHAPMHAEAWLELAKNLRRQAFEFSRPELLVEVQEYAIAGLLHRAPAPEMAIPALQLIAGLPGANPSPVRELAFLARARYPERAAEIDDFIESLLSP
jgi:hypothetical protein